MFKDKMFLVDTDGFCFLIHSVSLYLFIVVIIEMCVLIVVLCFLFFIAHVFSGTLYSNSYGVIFLFTVFLLYSFLSATRNSVL